MKTNRKSAEFQPNRVLSYFKAEWRALLIVTVSGLIYNIGLLTGPWFEGTMTGYLVEILNGTGQLSGMLMLVIRFAVVTAVVQISRYVKRFYVRRFANNVNRRMKETLFGSLVKKSRASLREEGEGNIMTKAILDVDDCVEGMRKFTTEIFDTGVALTAYLCMLLWYDWRLTILCMLFPPISYVTAEKMKKVIQKAGAAYKEQSGRLSTATLDRAKNAITYRVFGLEKKRQAVYEENLTSYEKAAVKANIWNAAMPPIYRIISMAGVFFILYFGQKNVLGTGWQAWSIASFTTFLVCFVKLSVKSSSAAKLFNAVHKAQVSWNRIKPLLPQEEENEADEVKVKETPVEALKVKHLSFTYPDGKKILDDISFSAKKGQIIGITGAVACGKSTLGKAFLCEYPYEGHITVDGAELQNMEQSVRTGIVGYLGHDPELFNDSVENNVLLGDSKNSDTYLNAACMKQEVAEMTDGKNTLIGSGGAYLSGGQAKRLAFARTLCHDKPILILDDPFSALDKNTEKQAFVNLQALAKDSIVLLISHRLYLFPEMDGVIWMENGKAVTGTTTISVPISQPNRFEVGQLELSSDTIYVGDTGSVTLSYVNKGKNPVSNLEARLTGTNLGAGSYQYLGNLNAGTEGSVDFDITPDAAGAVSGIITLSYEDASGNPQTVSKDFSVSAEEMNMDDFYDPSMDDMQPEQTGMPVWAWVLIGVCGAVVVVVIIVVVVRKRRKAKALTALEAEDSDEDI